MPDKPRVRSLEDIDENLKDAKEEDEEVKKLEEDQDDKEQDEEIEEESPKEEPEEDIEEDEDKEIEEEETQEVDDEIDSKDVEEKQEEKLEEYSESEDFKKGIYPEDEENKDEPKEDLRENPTHPPAEESLDDLAEENIEKEEIVQERYESNVHIPNLRNGNGQPPYERPQVPQPTPIGSSFSNKYYGQKPKSSKFHLLVLILIGLAVIGGTVYLLKNQFQTAEVVPSPTPTVEPSPMPSPSPSPTVDRAQYKVRVLNGTSQSGLAATISEKLKALGYQSERVGNATNSAFTQTVVRVKPDRDLLLEQLIKDLAPDYSAASSSALRATDPADAEVILGTD